MMRLNLSLDKVRNCEGTTTFVKEQKQKQKHYELQEERNCQFCI